MHGNHPPRAVSAPTPPAAAAAPAAAKEEDGDGAFGGMAKLVLGIVLARHLPDVVTNGILLVYAVYFVLWAAQQPHKKRLLYWTLAWDAYNASVTAARAFAGDAVMDVFLYRRWRAWFADTCCRRRSAALPMRPPGLASAAQIMSPAAMVAASHAFVGAVGAPRQAGGGRPPEAAAAAAAAAATTPEPPRPAWGVAAAAAAQQRAAVAAAAAAAAPTKKGRVHSR